MATFSGDDNDDDNEYEYDDDTNPPSPCGLGRLDIIIDRSISPFLLRRRGLPLPISLPGGPRPHP